MENLLIYALSVFTGFFAIMNPIANIPIFLGLTKGKDKESKRRIASVASITAFFIVAVFVVVGKYIFELFGITVPAFKITGGILIFYVGFEMLMSQKSKIQSNNSQENNNIAVSPLAIPILAGPGTIVTAMNHATDADFINIVVIIITLFFIILLNYLTFILSDSMFKKPDNNIILVIGKLMGLILAIIGTGMIVEGIKLAFGLEII